MLRNIFVFGLIAIFGFRSAFGSVQALQFYLWLAYFRPETWLWDPSLFLALRLSLLVGIYLTIRAFPEFSRPPFDFRASIFVVFFFLSTISTALSPAPDGTLFVRWQEFTKQLTVGYLVYALASRDLPTFRLVMMTMALSLGFEAAKQGVVSLITRPGGRNDNALPQLGDNNGVAIGMFMLAPMCLALANTCTGKYAWLEKRMHQFFFVGIVYRGITTYSRGGFLAIGAMTMVYIFRSKQKFRAILGTVVVATLLLPVLPDAFWERMDTITADEEEMDTSSASRVHFWRVAVDIANARPLTGVGIMGYQYVYNDYDFSNGFYGKSRAVHSSWFGMLAELGYPGILLFLCMLGLAFSGAGTVARMAKRGRVSMEFYGYAVGLQVAIAAGAVGATFVAWQWTEFLWHTVALSMGLRALALKQAAKAPQSALASTAAGHSETALRPEHAASSRART